MKLILCAFDKLSVDRQDLLLSYVSAKWGWTLEHSERELRELDHVGLAYLGVEMRESGPGHVAGYDPFEREWSA